LVGEQKFNDFTVGEAKIGEKQSRQSRIVQNFCVLSNLTAYKVTFKCKLQKKNWWSRMY